MAKSRAERVVHMLVFIIVVISIVMAGFGSAVLYMWNWLMPAVFGLHPITYWQAVGLLGLSWILFGGMRGWFWPRMHRGYGMGERSARMTPEERERFRAGMRRGCGPSAPTTVERNG
jgi:hypothetical protein